MARTDVRGYDMIGTLWNVRRLLRLAEPRSGGVGLACDEWTAGAVSQEFTPETGSAVSGVFRLPTMRCRHFVPAQPLCSGGSNR